jgi:hypothetical protein
MVYLIILILGLFPVMHGCLRFSLVGYGYPWLFKVIPGYPWLSTVILGYLRLSLVFYGYLRFSTHATEITLAKQYIPHQMHACGLACYNYPVLGVT